MCGPPSITTHVGFGFMAYEAVVYVEPWVLGVKGRQREKMTVISRY